MSAFDKETEVAVEAARRAARVILEVYSQDFDVSYKHGDEPVTEADRKANDLLVSQIHSAFPNDSIIAEETVPDDPLEVRKRTEGHRVWFIDPIDGTWEFIAKNGEFSVMIGLAVDGRAQLGVVLRPTTGRLAVGIIGRGMWFIDRDGTKHEGKVSDITEPWRAKLLLSRSHQSERLKRVAKRTGAGKLVPCGSVGVKAMRIASGTEDMYVLLPKVGGAKLWDTCAPEVLVRAAGGIATDVRGKPLDYRSDTVALKGGLVASNGKLHDVLLESVKDIPTLS